jgi:rubrerythrin
MLAIEALKLALEKENGSIVLYEKLANTHAEIKDLLSDLLNEEYKHKKRIEERIRELTKY